MRYFIEDRLVNAATESVGEETPLHCAAENGHLSTVMYLVGVQLVDPQILDGQLISTLYYSVVQCHTVFDFSHGKQSDGEASL